MNVQPDKIKQLVASIIIALIPLLIVNSLFSPFDQEKLDVTAFEIIKNEQSEIQVLLKNIGTDPAENIKVYVYNSFNYVGYKTTDTIPVEEKLEQDRIHIDRLAPDSFLVLTFKKPINDEQKTIWVTHNQETIFLDLKNATINQGISSVDLNKDRKNTLMVVGVFGFSALFVFRFMNFYRSEVKRKEFLGIHKINPVKFRSKHLKYGIAILVTAFIVGVAVDEYAVPEPISNYSPYEIFLIPENVSLETFVELKSPKPAYGTGGSVLFIFALFVALAVSGKDINLPKFEWHLKPKPSSILIKQTEFSFLNSKVVSDTSQLNIKESDIEVFVVKTNDTIHGLINPEETEDLDIGKKPKAKTILKNKELPAPPFDKDEKIRKNFIVINENETLETLKNQMEENYKKFAIVENDDKEITGVLNYDDFFGKHISL